MSSATPVPWGAFSQDPRQAEAARLRASDRDRDVVHGVLAEAYADGRLARDEYDERSSATSAAKTLGDLVPVITDLVPVTPVRIGSDLATATPDDLDRRALQHWQRQRREAINGFLFIAVICWTIWAISGFGFPWPIFPTLFVGLRVPQVLTNRGEIVAKEREKLERKQRKAIEHPDDD